MIAISCVLPSMHVVSSIIDMLASEYSSSKMAPSYKSHTLLNSKEVLQGMVLRSRFITSNSNLQWDCRRMRSPLGRVSSLLSSITLFMFSTHTASTSPSNTRYLASSWGSNVISAHHAVVFRIVSSLISSIQYESLPGRH